MIFDDSRVGENVRQRFERLLFRQNAVQFPPGESVLQHAEETVALREIVVDQIDKVIGRSDSLNHFPERK